uniref:Uncharacterized protein n=1 Tax=Tanacetum cinerariifolium TaxID=118510 RepID=A0A699L4P0_TANCI|nr:hypothetical protein [Tanacetum cinerariifolium]
MAIIVISPPVAEPGLRRCSCFAGFLTTSWRIGTSRPASGVSSPFYDPDPDILVARATAKCRSTPIDNHLR